MIDSVRDIPGLDDWRKNAQVFSRLQYANYDDDDQNDPQDCEYSHGKLLSREFADSLRTVSIPIYSGHSLCGRAPTTENNFRVYQSGFF